ncbi:MAG: 2-isopropylmalate synthase [Lentisphaerae bacterium]|nr:2-isopropylmalate synthase [Lentisphaerota bacterium]
MKKTLKNVSEPNLIRDTFSYRNVPAFRLDAPPAEQALPEDFWITDTTFRDGQQSRVPYTKEEIVELYKLMNRLGGKCGLIRQSEFFLYSENDRKSVEACQELGFQFPEITAWIRAVRKDFDLVKAMQLKETGILTSCSDYHIFLKLRKNRRQALDGYKDVVAAALEHGIVPRCHLEDVTRADIEGFVIPMINELDELGKSAGINVKFRLCDTMGYGLPYEKVPVPRGIPSMLTMIRRETDVSSSQLEWHGHNDFHHVSANGVCAWLYGCASVNSTFLGYGERTGNPPLEGMVIQWLSLAGHREDGPDTTAITDMANFYRKMNSPIPANYPFVGDDFNTTRAGVHADGLNKNEEIYNIFDTETLLNRPCKVAVSNTSGLAGIAYWVQSKFPAAIGMRKDSPGIIEIKNWIDNEYAGGRTTTISDDEMFALLRRYLPELFTENDK